MIRQISALLLTVIVLAHLCMLGSVAQAQTTQPAQPESWLTWLFALLGTAISVAVLPWLRQKAAEARATAELSRIQLGAVSQATMQQLLQAVRDEAYQLALNTAEQRFPRLAEKVISGEIKRPSEIKEELYDWGIELRKQLLDQFEARGIDVVAALGDAAIDSAIRYAADRVSPFPGKETAQAMLIDNYSNLLVTKGVQWLRSYLLSKQDNTVQP